MEAEELYQALILDHFKNPRNQGPVSDDDCLAEAINPMCGDVIRVAASLEDDTVSGLRYHARGCAICLASASMMSEFLPGRSVADGRVWVDRFIALMKGDEDFPEEGWGELAALQAIRRYPMRIKCATLAWVAMAEALEKLR